MMNQYFQISDVEGSLFEFCDLMAVSMKNENLRSFLNDWEYTLTCMEEKSAEDIWLSCFGSRFENTLLSKITSPT